MENYTRRDFKNQGNIKWNRSDAMKLSAAIRSFNKKIDKIKTLENENFIPGKLNYQIAKSEIFTRSELNRMIKSLNRFKKENAGDLIKTEGGEILTRWEKNELAFQSRNLRARLTRELNETITERGLSPNQMGDERIDALKSQIESLKNLNKVQGKTYSITYYDPLANAEKTITCYTSQSTAECYSGVLNSKGLWQGVTFKAIQTGGE